MFNMIKLVLSKASLSIVSIPLPSTTDCRDLQELKAYLPMVLTVPGITIDLIFPLLVYSQLYVSQL